MPLKHCETVDKGAPAIDPDAHIGQNRHREVMEDAVAAAKQRLQQQQGAA